MKKKTKAIWCYYNPETLEYKEARWFKPFLFTTIALLVISTFIWGYQVGSTKTDIDYRERGVVLVDGEQIPIILKEKEDVPTKRKVWEMLNEMNVKFPNIVFAQMCLESGHLESGIFKASNNMFGMKRTEGRINMQDGAFETHDGRVFGAFDNWRHSVIDYALYQARYLSDLTEDQYYAYLDKVYARPDEPGAYVNKVKQIANNVDDYLDE